MSTSRPLRRSGFTLTELLVVIVIIAILVGITLPAVQYVRNRAKSTRIRVDIQNLENAVEDYKLKGDYPPDFSRKDVVRRHILKVWPRIDRTTGGELDLAWSMFWVDPLDDNNNLSNVDPAEALVFWLGGFSKNPKKPFTGTDGPWVIDNSGNVYANPERAAGAFNFAQVKDRLTFNTTPITWVDANGNPKYGWVSSDTASPGDVFPVFLPAGRKVPYVYFDARTYGGNLANTAIPLAQKNGFYTVPGGPLPAGHGFAKPYLSTRAKPVTAAAPFGFEWVNPKSFQIISAGLDDCYGGDAFLADIAFFPRYPSGDNYLTPGPGDDDNVTNFSEGSMKGAGQ
jgi:prepilin-type N-terminal cleavage/methylation domain-containing protein